MKFGNDISSRFGRIVFSAFTLLLMPAIIGSVLEGTQPGVFSWPIVLLLFWMLIYSLYEHPNGTLTEEGIYVRHFFVQRFYRWSDIRQVGILDRDGRPSYYQIVLVKPCGTLRTPETKAFLFRNQFRLIHIPYSESVLHYIVSCYGPLDFDQRGM